MKKIVIAMSLLTAAFTIGSIESCTKSSNKTTNTPVIAASTTDTTISADTTTKLSWYEYGATDSTRLLQVTLTYLPDNHIGRTFNDTLFLYTSNGITWALQEGFHDDQYSTSAFPNTTTFNLYFVRTTSSHRDTLIKMHN